MKGCDEAARRGAAHDNYKRREGEPDRRFTAEVVVPRGRFTKRLARRSPITITRRGPFTPTACRGDKIERMASRVQNPNQPDRPTDESVHDVLLTWFTTPRLQDELIGRDREAVKTVLDLLRRRMRQQRQPSRSRT